MSFDCTADPGHDDRYCDSISADPQDDEADRAEQPAFNCAWCGYLETDDRQWPYCADGPCATNAEECDRTRRPPAA